MSLRLGRSAIRRMPKYTAIMRNPATDVTKMTTIAAHNAREAKAILRKSHQGWAISVRKVR